MRKRMTATTFATTAAIAVKDSEDLEILGAEHLKGTKSVLGKAQVIPEDVCITKRFKKEENFFYTATLYSGNDIDTQEVGVGELYSKGRGKNRKFYLRREKSLYIITSKSQNKTRGEIHEFKGGQTIIIETYIPQLFNDLFVKPFSIPCSIDAHLPTIVELQENCLVGRLDDIIQSIDKYELWSILTSGKCPSKPVKGSIRYNDEAACFEGYDGDRWRSLLWGDE
jgi:hypothetical protein